MNAMIKGSIFTCRPTDSPEWKAYFAIQETLGDVLERLTETASTAEELAIVAEIDRVRGAATPVAFARLSPEEQQRANKQFQGWVA